MANEDPIWRDLDNNNGHKIYMYKKSPSDTAIIVNSTCAAKMKKTRIHRHNHYMALAAMVDNIYNINTRAPRLHTATCRRTFVVTSRRRESAAPTPSSSSWAT